MHSFLHDMIQKFNKKYSNIKNIPLKVALIYSFAGWLWVLICDRLLSTVAPGIKDFALESILKGLLYIIAPSMLLYALIKIEDDRNTELNNSLQQTNEILNAAGLELEQKCTELEKTQADLKENQEKMEYFMYHDYLTGFYNRNYFLHKLQGEIQELSSKVSMFALLNIDIDNFKKINDLVGHDMGDQCLVKISEILSNIIADENQICRIGGDQFIILLKDVYSKEQICSLLREIQKRLQNHFKIGDMTFSVTSSAGVTVFPDDGKNPSLLFRNADMAMYEAKKLGKNRYCFYNRSINEKIFRKTDIENSFSNALENGEFKVFYQPKYSASKGEISGFEALIRWQHPKYGIISPVEFIPIAEETGFIIPLGLWVLRKTCEQIREWIDKGYKGYSVSVNVSVIQLRQDNFKNDILNVIKEYDLSTEYIELEITESTLIHDIDKNVEILNELRNEGISIALDDFGTGYSSLNYLVKIPISTLKIDKSFIDEICENNHEKIITDIIIKLAHQMDFEVVAEGVERKEQLEVLQNLCCDKIQGYYFSKPLLNEDAELLLKEKVAV